MIKNILIPLIVALCGLIYSCESDKESIVDEKSGSSIVISVGSMCGWCAPMDSISFSESSFYYLKRSTCESDPTKRDAVTTGTISQANWDELLSLLDFDDFKSVELNSCNICVDGCDYWIWVNTGTESHYIRYGTGDSDSMTIIQDFVDKLDELAGNIRTSDLD